MKELRSREVATALPSRLQRAEVLDVASADEILIRLHHARTEEVIRAEVAVMQYAPQTGDIVLVAAQLDAVFVLGVLGAARRREVRASTDVLVLSAENKIVIDAPEIEVRATRLETTAASIIERADETHRHAGESHISAGRCRTVVDDSFEVVAGRTRIVSDDDTAIDGRRVLLG